MKCESEATSAKAMMESALSKISTARAIISLAESVAAGEDADKASEDVIDSLRHSRNLLSDAYMQIVEAKGEAV